MASTTRDAVTQHWDGKALSLSNGRWLKRALGAASNRDRSSPEGSAGKELTTPNERRAAALRAMRDHDISQRRACRLVGVDPKIVRRDRPPDNPEIRAEMKAVAHKRRRFGYPLAVR